MEADAAWWTVTTDMTATTPNPKMQELALDYQKAMTEYQTIVKQSQNDLAKYEDQLFLPIEKKVKGIFTRLAEELGLGA